MATDVVKRNLLPESLVDSAVHLPLSEFLSLHGDTQFLFVRVNDMAGELAATLAASQRTGDSLLAPATNAIAYRTAIGVDESSQTSAIGDFGVAELLRMLVRNPYFVVPLRKRSSDETYAERISVGRARNKDVVLRHRSVSKFHAWFELTGDGTVVIADAGSRNGTRVNGEQIDVRVLTALRPGDRIRMGSVDAVLCAPELLWSALRP